MDFNLSVLEWTILLASLVLGGVVKGVTGMGLPMIITPPLAWAFGMHMAVPLVAVPTLLTNILFIHRYRRAWREVLQIWPMLAAGLLAIIAGVAFLQVGDPRYAAWLLAVLAVFYALSSLLGWEITFPLEKSALLAPLLGAVAGVFQGATGVSGPPVVAYLSSVKGLSREGYFQAMGLIFFLFGLQQIGALTLGGSYTSELAALGVIAVVPVLLSFYLGTWLQSRLDPVKFKRVTMLVILISGLNLFFSNL